MRNHGDDLRRLAVIALNLAPDEQIEFLVRAAHFDIAFERDRIVSLRQRIQQLVHGDRHAFFEALGEIVALEQPGHGVFGAELNHVLN